MEDMATSDGNTLRINSAFQSYMAFCAFNFGYDVRTFSGVQAMQPFARQFGHYDEEQVQWVLAGWLRSVMTATPFIRKAAVSLRIDRQVS